jgi:surfeit locus 1 family protein
MKIKGRTIKFQKPSIASSLAVLIALLILSFLGTWQVYRLEWKESLLSDLQTAKDNPQELLWSDIETAGDRFIYGRVTGHIQWDKTIPIQPRTYKGKAGYHIIAPFVLEDGVIFVNLGFSESKSIAYRNDSLMTLRGLARVPLKENSFVPDNDWVMEVWYRVDLSDFQKARDVKSPISPYVMYVEDMNGKDKRDYSGLYHHDQGFKIANNHLSYACFWYGMGLIAFVMFLLRFVVIIERIDDKA